MVEQLIFTDVAAVAGVPIPYLTLNTVGPTIMRYGTTAFAAKEVATCTGEGVRRRSYADVGARAARLANARAKLFAARETRVRPGCDDKQLTSWNALMVAGLAHAGRVMARPDWIDAAQDAIDFLHRNVWRGGRLLASTKHGEARLNAYLDDYAFLLDALLESLQAGYRETDMAWARELAGSVPVVFVPDYRLAVARRMVAGVDLWLNTPQPPLEASGTSGMKAALNGVPSLSVLDGWWIEGCEEGFTGWAIGDDADRDPVRHAASLYDKLEHTVLPAFYEDGHAWATVMKSAIALNGSYFNSHRMIRRYASEAYWN